jgi:hypothetical protein
MDIRRVRKGLLSRTSGMKHKAVMFDQLASAEEERRQGVTMDERGGELMLVSPRPLDRIGLDGLPATVTQAGEQAR